VINVDNVHFCICALSVIARNQTVFWDAAPCILLEIYRRFRGASGLCHRNTPQSATWHKTDVTLAAVTIGHLTCMSCSQFARPYLFSDLLNLGMTSLFYQIFSLLYLLFVSKAPSIKRTRFGRGCSIQCGASWRGTMHHVSFVR
jgi:hypothetical protein